MAIDADAVKVIVQEYMEEKVVFRGNCQDRHKALDNLRSERGKELEKVEISMKELTATLNGKLNKLYLSIIGTLATTLITLLAVIFTRLLKG